MSCAPNPPYDRKRLNHHLHPIARRPVPLLVAGEHPEFQRLAARLVGQGGFGFHHAQGMFPVAVGEFAAFHEVETGLAAVGGFLPVQEHPAGTPGGGGFENPALAGNLERGGRPAPGPAEMGELVFAVGRGFQIAQHGFHAVGQGGEVLLLGGGSEGNTVSPRGGDLRNSSGLVSLN